MTRQLRSRRQPIRNIISQQGKSLHKQCDENLSKKKSFENADMVKTKKYPD